MPCAYIFHGMAAPILGSHFFMVGWESMRLVTHEARDPMNRCKGAFTYYVICRGGGRGFPKDDAG